MQVVQVTAWTLAWTVSQFYNLRSHSNLLHALGLLLNISGIFRFWLNFHAFESLCLLLFNWILCILLECVAVEILFQIPWNHLKLQNVTLLRYFVFATISAMGLMNVYSMCQLCMEVHGCVLSHPEYSWVIIAPLLWLTKATAIFHAVVLATCIPVQVIIVPLECNKNIPNINFKSHVTLAVNLWLFLHFVYLNISYSHYSAIALFYRLCCTVWMFLYCYPGQTQSIYHWFKRQLPKWIRSILRPVRDRLVIKVWRNLRVVIKWRSSEGNMVDNQTSLLNMLNILRSIITSLWTMLCRNANFWIRYVTSCILVSCLLKCYTGWGGFTSILLIVIIISIHFTVILYLTFYYCFFQPLADHITQLMEPINNAPCFVSINSSHGTVEEILETSPTSCTDE